MAAAGDLGDTAADRADSAGAVTSGAMTANRVHSPSGLPGQENAPREALGQSAGSPGTAQSNVQGPTGFPPQGGNVPAEVPGPTGSSPQGEDVPAEVPSVAQSDIVPLGPRPPEPLEPGEELPDTSREMLHGWLQRLVQQEQTGSHSASAEDVPAGA